MKISTYLILLSGLIIFGCTTSHQHDHSSPWQVKSSKNLFLDQGLENVESVLHDQQNQVLYITNGQDYIPGTDGFISKASVDGTEIDLRWITGLNRPTGMALKGDQLYVADLNQLLRINTKIGEVIERYEESIQGSALNDVTIDDNGDVYVSASRLGAVFKLVDGALQLWVQDKVQLKYANGLLGQKGDVLVAGFNLSSIQFDPKRLDDIHTHPSIKDLEGIVSDGKNGYFITSAGTSSLFHVSSDWEAAPLLVERDYMSDLSFDQQNNTLYIPRGNEDTGAFYITVVELNN
ncbi:MAG: hypothetical protein R8G66_10755 [Cytophagales bacterium]|nr:hypothetical protein [Cytophagales bacterium]